MNGETSWICPLCGHGKGGDGLTRNPRSEDGHGLKCFACGFGGDIIDLYQKATGADYNKALLDLAQKIGLTIEGGAAPSERPAAAKPAEPPEEPEAPPVNYIGYYRECAARISDPAAASYLSARGISQETALRYGLGYDPAADPASNPGGSGQPLHPAPRIIIPTSREHYIARSIDPSTPAGYRKLNPKGSTPAIFNGGALYRAQEVFVTEGAFDALSILEAGAEAIALNSAANAEKLIEQLEKKRTEATLILCLDNDEAGQKAQAKQAKFDFETHLQSLEEYVQNFTESLRQCESAEGRDRMKAAQMFCESVTIRTAYDNTEFIKGLAAILAGQSVAALDTGIKKISQIKETPKAGRKL